MKNRADKKTETMTFRLSPELKNAIELLATARDISPSKFVERAISESIQREKQLCLSLNKAFGQCHGTHCTHDPYRDDL